MKKLFMLMLCAILGFNCINATDTQNQEQNLQDQVMRLASSNEPFDDEMLSNVADQIQALHVGFDLTKKDHTENPELWKQLVATIIKFYSSCLNTDSKQEAFNNMITCLNNLSVEGSYGKINVLMGTQDPAALQQDPLETLEQKD